MRVLTQLIIIIILISNFSYLFAQQCSVISDKKTKEGIAYSSIIIIQKSAGIITDEKGKFCLEISKNLSDSVLISALGYENQKITFNQFVKSDTIYLNEKRVILNEVIVKKARLKTKRLGPFHKKLLLVSYSFNQNSKNILVSKINNDELLNGFISTIHYRLAPHKSDFAKKYRLRCRIFQNGKNDNPTEDILSKNVIIDINPTDKFVNVNVDSLNIPFKEKSLWVGVQTIGYIDNLNNYVALSEFQIGKAIFDKNNPNKDKVEKYQMLSPYYMMTDKGEGKISSFGNGKWANSPSSMNVPLFGITITY
jgi:hypothetical protein